MAHISLVTLGVLDLPAATGFYETLGWRRSSASVPGEVTFLHGTPVLALFDGEALARDAGLHAAPAQHDPKLALAINLPTVTEVDELLAVAERAGGRITRSPQPTGWGGYSGYFTDLEGHLWEVAHNPHFPLDADGRVTLPDSA
jgi:uncharacterized protein